MIEPRNDYILVQRLEDPQRGAIIVPDVAKEKGIKGKVLAIGPGKWIPGEWWKVTREAYGEMKGSDGRKVLHDEKVWEWFPGYRKRPQIHIGQIILFNSRWNDFAGNHEDDLPIEADPKLHLIQEADVFLKLHA
jgi:co-chaperonin GroES (HSP10)